MALFGYSTNECLVTVLLDEDSVLKLGMLFGRVLSQMLHLKQKCLCLIEEVVVKIDNTVKGGLFELQILAYVSLFWIRSIQFIE